jgi:hypothetical protein
MGALAMKWRARLVIAEPFEIEEEMVGEVVNLFWFKADNGRKFIIFPRHGIFEYIKFLFGEKIVVNMHGKEPGEAWLGVIQRL